MNPARKDLLTRLFKLAVVVAATCMVSWLFCNWYCKSAPAPSFEQSVFTYDNQAKAQDLERQAQLNQRQRLGEVLRSFLLPDPTTDSKPPIESRPAPQAEEVTRDAAQLQRQVPAPAEPVDRGADGPTSAALNGIKDDLVRVNDRLGNVEHTLSQRPSQPSLADQIAQLQLARLAMRSQDQNPSILDLMARANTRSDQNVRQDVTVNVFGQREGSCQPAVEVRKPAPLPVEPRPLQPHVQGPTLPPPPCGDGC